jgi:hypothetical protein
METNCKDLVVDVPLNIISSSDCQDSPIRDIC